jgi:hypothetical protein
MPIPDPASRTTANLSSRASRQPATSLTASGRPPTSPEDPPGTGPRPCRVTGCQPRPHAGFPEGRTGRGSPARTLIRPPETVPEEPEPGASDDGPGDLGLALGGGGGDLDGEFLLGQDVGQPLPELLADGDGTGKGLKRVFQLALAAPEPGGLRQVPDRNTGPWAIQLSEVERAWLA